jgi:acyl-CoA synthetase (AMP-forming)/AMP-acid ligase II
MPTIERSCYPRLSPEVVNGYRSAGLWRNRTIVDDLRLLVETQPDRVLYRTPDDELSAADLYADASALAAVLLGWGVLPSDVISYQLPSWVEAAVIDVAAAMIGAIVNPISIIYRQAEMAWILRDGGSKVLFVPDMYRGTDFPQLAAKAMAKAPDLEHVVVVKAERRIGSPGLPHCDDFAALLGEGRAASPRLPTVRPDDVKLLMYTSGTTGISKGVFHTHETSARTYRSFFVDLGLNEDDVLFVPSTVTHVTGYAYGMQMPLVCRTRTLFMDQWAPEAAYDLVRRHRATAAVGAVPFLVDLTKVCEARGEGLPSLRYFACGGAAVTPGVIRAARLVLRNTKIFRLYGSTETGNVTSGFVSPGDEDLAAETDGRISDCEVRVCNEQGDEVAGEGEICVRGSALFIGYVSKDETRAAFTDDGFFRTGDLGVVTDRGALTITGRKKDLIIRGGYNISAKEIEDVLYDHPQVAEIAVVGQPDPRLGERICAFVVPEDQQNPPTLESFSQMLSERGFARQKFPERIVLVGFLPKTAAGKVQKYVLRQAAVG